MIHGAKTQEILFQILAMIINTLAGVGVLFSLALIALGNG
jgi:hypothetical protein